MAIDEPINSNCWQKWVADRNKSASRTNKSQMMYQVPLTNLPRFHALLPLKAHPFCQYVVRMLTALSSAVTIRSGGSFPISMQKALQVSSEHSAAALESYLKCYQRTTEFQLRMTCLFWTNSEPLQCSADGWKGYVNVVLSKEFLLNFIKIDVWWVLKQIEHMLHMYYRVSKMSRYTSDIFWLYIPW